MRARCWNCRLVRAGHPGGTTAQLNGLDGPAGKQVRATPGPVSARFGAGLVLRDSRTPVPRVLLFVTLAGLRAVWLCQRAPACLGCSRSLRPLPGSGCLSHAALLRQGQRRWSLNSAGIGSTSRRTGWNPDVFFHTGAACCFSKCEITAVASASTGIQYPARRPLPGQRPGPLPDRGPCLADRPQRLVYPRPGR
jgi:hypothetical protein